MKLEFALGDFDETPLALTEDEKEREESNEEEDQERTIRKTNEILFKEETEE